MLQERGQALAGFLPGPHFSRFFHGYCRPSGAFAVIRPIGPTCLQMSVGNRLRSMVAIV
jgi:hypothetical protein